MTVLGINRADLMQERYRIVQPPKERVVLPEVERTAEEPRMPVRKPAPESEQRPADRLDIAAKRFIIEDERKLAAGRAAAAAVNKNVERMCAAHKKSTEPATVTLVEV